MRQIRIVYMKVAHSGSPKQEGNAPIDWRVTRGQCIGGYLIIYQIFQGLYLAYLKRYGPET